MTDLPPVENPYESPVAASENPFAVAAEKIRSPSQTPEQEKYDRLGRLFIAWEKLRFIYNIALAVLTLPIVILLLLQAENVLQVAESLAFVCIGGAIAANLCFTAGYYINARLLMMGIRGKTATILLFWSGIVISIPLVVLALAGSGKW